jgi:RimJ/RimL family protein N-acetyltransferase
MESFETERLLLRPWNDSDVDFAFDMYSRWDVQRFLGTSPRVMESRNEAIDKVAGWAAMAEHPVHGLWLMQERSTGRRLGQILLKPLPASGETVPLEPSGDVEIGWHQHPDAWGNGYVTEAAARILGHAFDAGLPRVLAVVYAENTASQAVARRIGMEHRGSTDAYYNTTVELFEARAD